MTLMTVCRSNIKGRLRPPFILYPREMTRKRKHIREVQKYLDMLMLDQVNITLHASRFGWTTEIQNQLTNSALLIRKYQRRLRLIKM